MVDGPASAGRSAAPPGERPPDSRGPRPDARSARPDLGTVGQGTGGQATGQARAGQENAGQDTFLYCAYVDPAVARACGARLGPRRPAVLHGHRIAFCPHVSLRPSPGGQVHGFLTRLDKASQRALYGNASPGHRFHPLAVQVTTDDGDVHATTYADHSPERAPTREYVELVAGIWQSQGIDARQLGASLPVARPALSA